MCIRKEIYGLDVKQNYTTNQSLQEERLVCVRTDRIIGIFIIDSAMHAPKIGRLIGNNLKLHWVGTHAISSKDFHGLVKRPTGWLIIMKQISRQEYHITLFEIN